MKFHRACVNIIFPLMTAWLVPSSFFLLTLLGSVTIRLQIYKKQITIEVGNAAQKGRYERETHAGYRPGEKKNAKNIRYMTK